MSKYISKTKSKIIFKEIAEKEIENLKQGDLMSNKILADIIARREALRAQQAQRSSEKQRMLQAIHNHKASAQQSKLDEFEKEYEAFIAEQRRLKEEREAKEAAAKEAEVEVPVDVPVEEVKDDVISEEDTISENSKEVQIVETKPKKKTKKKTVVEATETVE
ncbi:MAG: hypothetical protein ACI4V7_06400 [Succinivibrionaceae bacterium]